MTKQELIEKLVEEHPNLTKKEMGEMVEQMGEEIAGAVKSEGKFTLAGFGTFTLRKRKPRTGRNPQTGAEVKIPASKTIGFKPAKSLKETL